jgi:hypothetical protein
MSTKTKTLAKSLHTITAIQRMAEYIRKHGPCAELKTDAQAVREALEAFGYADAADPYDLAGKALKAIQSAQAPLALAA